MVLGGETTVSVRGDGHGGRNQELALAAAIELDGAADCHLVSLATDGEDADTNAAGAVATGDSLSRARSAGLDPAALLDNNDSYSFFSTLGDLIVSGPTQTNLCDVMLLFCGKM